MVQTIYVGVTPLISPRLKPPPVSWRKEQARAAACGYPSAVRRRRQVGGVRQSLGADVNRLVRNPGYPVSERKVAAGWYRAAWTVRDAKPEADPHIIAGAKIPPTTAHHHNAAAVLISTEGDNSVGA